VQQLAEAGAGLAAAAMPAPGPMFGQELGRLQGLLDEGIGQADAVVALDRFVEVVGVEPRVALPVQAQNALDLGDGRAPRRGMAPAPIPEPVVAEALVAQPPPGRRVRAFQPKISSD
jgi:hypothetical protein